MKHRTLVAVLTLLVAAAGATAVLAARKSVFATTTTTATSTVTTTVTTTAPTPTAQVLDTSFYSHALRSALHFLIVLPPGYATSGLRYPVVYFLHGLPAGPTSYQALAWIGTSLQQTGKQSILVIPQGSRRPNGDPEYHDWGPGHNWESALAGDLPRYVDATYRTIASRRGRAIVGLSAGGYGAAILDVHHPREYAVMESWSGYFRPTDPTGESTLDVGSDADNAYASVFQQVSKLKASFSRNPTYFAFYIGTSDPTFVPDNVQLDHALRVAHVYHVFDEYPGGHSNALWQGHAVAWLRAALNHLQSPQ
jgi:enterochelin esterase-like enzyme